ncbi:hypothetical protein HWV62_37960 [Athelia sp. TMB]|nr:hypothetical protein HWV62_37960 [Athelia sp. TMB]
MTSKPPSAILADAISTLSKSVSNAFSIADAEARAEIAKANTETRDALRERDDLRKLLHETQLAEKTWKEEISTWKAAAEKVEIANHHQVEAIGQLRQEARQWKDQCLRLEETSRDWKEQFVRVEQERASLLSRIEELMAERMVFHVPPPLNLNASHFTPNARYEEYQGSSAPSAAVKRASTASNPFQSSSHKSLAPISTSDRDSPSESHYDKHRSRSSKTRPREEDLTSPPSKQARSRAQTLQAPLSKTSRVDSGGGRASHHQNSPTRIARQEGSLPEPRQQIIRRVTATFQTHVKEEDMDEEGIDGFASASASVGPSSSAEAEASHGGTATGARNKIRLSKRSVQEDEDDSYEEDEDIRAVRKGKALPSSSGTDDEDEDELNLMSQTTDVGREGHATNARRAADTPLRSRTTAAVSKSGGSSGKKRKVTTSRPIGGSALKARRL